MKNNLRTQIHRYLFVPNKIKSTFEPNPFFEKEIINLYCLTTNLNLKEKLIRNKIDLHFTLWYRKYDFRRDTFKILYPKMGKPLYILFDIVE